MMVELHRRLVVPSGIARIWWNVRSNFIGARKMGRRLEELRRAIVREGLLPHRHEVWRDARKAREERIVRTSVRHTANQTSPSIMPPMTSVR